MEEAIRKPNVQILNKMFAHHNLFVLDEMNKLERYSLYNKGTSTYFGSFTAEFETSDNVVYVLTYTPVGIDTTDTTDNPDELVYMISEFNKSRVAPPYCYDISYTAWTRQYDTFVWYLEQRGFTIEDSLLADRCAIYKNGDTKMSIYFIGDQSDFTGEVWKEPVEGERLVKTRYFDVESFVSALHNIVDDMHVINSNKQKNLLSQKKELFKKLINELIDKFL